MAVAPPHLVADPLGRPSLRRALIVANPISGHGQGQQAARDLQQALMAKGIGAELYLTQGRNDAFRRLRGLSTGLHDLVIAVGGDGTVREVVAGLVDPAIPIGILPLGTANVLAGEFDLPRDVHEAVEILARGKTAALDVALVNGFLSCFVTGVGIDGMAVQEVERHRNGPITKFAYVRAILRVLPGYRQPKLRVEIDGKLAADDVGLVLVSNARGYGGVFRLSRAAQLDDGLLEVYCLPHASRARLARAALTAATTELARACAVRQGRHIRISAAEPVPYQVDGEFRGTTPVEIELSPRQYRVVVP
ncbi:MAG: diacylglycerol kinase family lipid kinase [Planctomycetota bacterium]|nr:MAG: diacylglycerol kinase family lipid kinase [Planctomycetota bacterium]